MKHVDMKLIYERAYYHTLNLWHEEVNKCEECENTGINSIIHEYRRDEYWKELKEIENLLKENGG